MASKIVKSHRRKLNSVGIRIEMLNNDNIKAVFDTLKQLKPKLSQNYLISVLHTIKKENENVTRTAKALNLKKSKRISNPETTVGFLKILHHAIKNINKRHQIIRREIDTIIAIVVAIMTNVGSKELLLMKVKHLTELVENKKSTLFRLTELNSFPIQKYEPLFGKYYDGVLSAIKFRELEIYGKQDINLDTFVITCKIDSINKIIKEWYLQFMVKIPKESLGIQYIRKLNTSLILSETEKNVDDEDMYYS